MTQNPKRPLWKAYEDQIHRVLLNQVAPGATVTFDDGGRQRLPGRFSLVNRQIDVLVSPNSRAGEIDPNYSYSNVSVRPPHQGTAVTGRSACRSTGL